MPTLGRIRPLDKTTAPHGAPHPDHGNGLAGEPRLGPSVTLAIGIDPFEVPNQQQTEVHARRRTRAGETDRYR